MTDDTLFEESGSRYGAQNFEPRFDGASYEPKIDGKRLSYQLDKVLNLMSDHQWRTKGEIAAATGIADFSSVGARLTDLRKAKFGQYPVERRRRGEPPDGLWEYQVGNKGEGTPVEIPAVHRVKELEGCLQSLLAYCDSPLGISAQGVRAIISDVMD